MQYQDLSNRPFLIAGPCVIESEDLLFRVAEQMKTAAEQQGFHYIFKASFDKANRTSIHSFRGPGLDEGLRILEKVKQRFEVPILTDIHEAQQAAPAAEVVDILQIPAFLCRQTDLLVAAAKTQAIVNIKKAQFLSATDMKHVLTKVEEAGNEQLLLTERGSMYGFNNLIVDYTGILEMMDYGYPIIMDATHAVQKPGGAGGKSGGNRAYAPFMARAAAAIGVKGFFIETHPSPEKALSDGPNMIPLADMPALLKKLRAIMDLQLDD